MWGEGPLSSRFVRLFTSLLHYPNAWNRLTLLLLSCLYDIQVLKQVMRLKNLIIYKERRCYIVEPLLWDTSFKKTHFFPWQNQCSYNLCNLLPLLSGHSSLSRGCPLNGGFTVIPFKKCLKNNVFSKYKNSFLASGVAQ